MERSEQTVTNRKRQGWRGKSTKRTGHDSTDVSSNAVSGFKEMSNSEEEETMEVDDKIVFANGTVRRHKPSRRSSKGLTRKSSSNCLVEDKFCSAANMYLSSSSSSDIEEEDNDDELDKFGQHFITEVKAEQRMNKIGKNHCNHVDDEGNYVNNELMTVDTTTAVVAPVVATLPELEDEFLAASPTGACSYPPDGSLATEAVSRAETTTTSAVEEKGSPLKYSGDNTGSGDTRSMMAVLSVVTFAGQLDPVHSVRSALEGVTLGDACSPKPNREESFRAEITPDGSLRKRGRPKGSKNKPRGTISDGAGSGCDSPVSAGRGGRGRGSANLSQRGRRGRPPGPGRARDSPLSSSSTSTPRSCSPAVEADKSSGLLTRPVMQGGLGSVSMIYKVTGGHDAQGIMPMPEKRRSSMDKQKTKKVKACREKTAVSSGSPKVERNNPLPAGGTAVLATASPGTVPPAVQAAAPAATMMPSFAAISLNGEASGTISIASTAANFLSAGTAAVPLRRRGSKLSDSEDSSLSTDSPLKPKTYKRISMGCHQRHKEKKLDRRRSVGESTTTTTTAARDGGDIDERQPATKADRSAVAATAVASPVEEQPLFPKRYLEQKKMLEQETLDEQKQKQQQQPKQHQQLEAIGESEEAVEAKRLREAEDRKDVERGLKSFKHISESVYLCNRKISKQFRNMQCDCELSKEEVERGVMGCLDDCANKMLMIECGKDCPLDHHCSNKRLQNKENAPIEVFKTDWKGFGVRATTKIPKDTFIMEYVGEVLDYRQFRRRAKQYGRENNQHYYIMAVSRDCYVDATSKGNISRFINHCCEPNSMTQKWMVNGENRVGFFTKKDVEAGEEINFDYKYERYGQIAQKCFCGTPNCRGWLGKEPASDSGIEEMEEWTSSEEEEEEVEAGEKPEAKSERKAEERRSYEKKERRKMKKYNEEEEWEEDIQRLAASGIRNRLHTLELSRLMVRTTEVENRLRLAQLLIDADQPCRRLFLDYQGLRILSQWMQDLEWSPVELELKLKIQAVLANMSFPHRTMLLDSKVYGTMEQWAKASPWHSGRSSGTSSPGPPSRASSPPLGSTAEQPARPGTPTLRPSSPQSVDMEIEETDQRPATPSHRDIFCLDSEELYPPGEEPPGLILFPPALVQPRPASPPASPRPTSPSVRTTGPRPASTAEDDDISIVAEIPTSGKGKPVLTSSTSSRSKADMKLKVVHLSEVAGESPGKRGKGDELLKKVKKEKEEEELLKKCKVERLVNKEEEEELLKKCKVEMLVKKEEEEEELLKRGKVERLVKILSAQSGVGAVGGDGDSEEMGDVRVEPVPREEVALSEEEEKERQEVMGKVEEIRSRARHLLAVWVQLQEMFKIPKRERHKIRVEHEREADRQDCHSDRLTALQQAAMRYAEANRSGSVSDVGGRPVYRGGRPHPDNRLPPEGRYHQGGGGGGADIRPNGIINSPASPATIPRERRNLRLDDKSGSLNKIGLPREARRMHFEAKIQEEERQKLMRSAIAARHTQCCRLLGMNPATTPLLPQYPQQYEVAPGRWVAMPPHPATPDTDWNPPRMAWLPLAAYRPDDPKPVNPRDVYPAGICPPEPPPPPKVIKVPGAVSTVEEVTEYYEDVYAKAPKSPVISPPSSRASSRAPSPSRPLLSVNSGIAAPGSSRRKPPVVSAQAQNHQEMLDRLKQELHISKTEELPDHYRSPSPVEKRSVTPVPTALAVSEVPGAQPEPEDCPLHPPEEPSPRSSRRILPRIIDFLNSQPAGADNAAFPLPTQHTDPLAEMEVCQGPSLGTSGDQVEMTSASVTNGQTDSAELVVKLPPKWRIAKDGQGRIYYYHAVTKVSQWEPPTAVQLTEEGEDGGGPTSSGPEDERREGVPLDTLSSDEEDKEDDSDSDEEQEREGEEEVEVEDGELPQDQDLSASEKKMLLRIRNRNRLTKAERSSMRRLKRRKERQRREEERELLQARYTRHRETGLVEEHLVPFRTERDKADLSTFKEMKERLLHKDKILQQIDKEIKDEERKEKQEQERLKKEQKRAAEKVRREAAAAEAALNSFTSGKVGGGGAAEVSVGDQQQPQPLATPAAITTTAAADSSDVEKKIKDNFVKEMSKVIVRILNNYRTPGVPGHITSTQDFKHLAKKLTHTIMTKERQHCRIIEDLKPTDKVKKKAAEYVKKKMSIYEREYKRSPESK